MTATAAITASCSHGTCGPLFPQLTFSKGLPVGMAGAWVNSTTESSGMLGIRLRRIAVAAAATTRDSREKINDHISKQIKRIAQLRRSLGFARNI